MSGSVPISALREGDLISLGDVVVAQIDGRYHAVSGRCTHAGASLARARLMGHELTCPRHGARFDIRTGAETSGVGCAALATYTVVVDRGRLSVRQR